MNDQVKVLLGKGETHVELLAKFANRHGLIAGATGTGKTVSLQVLAEGLSRIGVPVFITDVKGDLSGISQAGQAHPKIDKRLKTIGIADFTFNENPAVFWDLAGDAGHPIRATITDMGPALLSRLLDLNEVQEGILTIAFRFADDEGMLMLDLKDLRSTLTFLGDNAKSFRSEYGNISSASVGAIQRRLLVLENEGADEFFGEPELDLWDLIRTDHNGQGMINVLDAQKLMMQPRLYSTFLLWLLSELFEELPEVGDQDKPRFVFFFDEAHLLFNGAPKVLVKKIETVVKLIRSKGVGIFFISQNPLDIPDEVLGQLGNRIQHALRAFTPRDQKAVRAAAQTMRVNPSFDSEQAISELGVGEALVTVLQDDGTPSIVQRVLMSPPRSRIGPATNAERALVMSGSSVAGRYDKSVDRASAYEILEERVEKQTLIAEKKAEQDAKAKAVKPARRGRQRQSIAEAAAKTFVRSLSSKLATRVIRGLLGSISRR
ncbi:MAG: helicase HerA-like domain-containing protein [Granulosicoccus sp.]